MPRFLQGDLIRRQIRNYSQTLCILWAFAILINLPLFALTKYEKIPINQTLTADNSTNLTDGHFEASCFTGATEIWSRTYLILLLVFTYVITGFFLIVIYGQVIRIILASNKYKKLSVRTAQSASENYRFLSPNKTSAKHHRSNFVWRLRERILVDGPPGHSSSSSSTGGSNRRQQNNRSPLPLGLCVSVDNSELNKTTASSHSTQHLQVIVMLFIVILLYILLLLPYRLFNLLYIVHNPMFQQVSMNDILFQCLLNSVRLLVFLNCALQPITYLIISSRLRQTVVKFLRSWHKCPADCRWSSSPQAGRHYESDTRAIRAYLTQKYQNNNNNNRPNAFRDAAVAAAPLRTSLNNIHLATRPEAPVNNVAVRAVSPLALGRSSPTTLYTVSFTNGSRK